MTTLACKDISPATTCAFKVEGESATEVATAMLAHARIVHAADIAALSDEEAIALFETKIPA